MKKSRMLFILIALIIICLTVLLNERYNVVPGIGNKPQFKIDTLTGRAWIMDDKNKSWVEVKDYGYFYHEGKIVVSEE